MKKQMKSAYFLLLFYGALLLVLALSALLVDWLPRYPDAFGYLSNAQYFRQSPFLWSEITGTMNSYYSYGYSVIISIFFFCFKSYKIISKAIFIFNAMTIMGIYMLLVKISNILLNDISIKMRYLICFTICLYPSFIYEVYVVSPELLSIFLYLLTILCVMRIEENHKWKKIYIIIFGGILPYMAAVHGRCLGLWPIGIVIMFLIFICKKITHKEFVYYMLVTILGIIIYKYVNDSIKLNVYLLNKSSSIANSSESVLKNVLKIFSLDGFKNIILTVLTQSFYLGSTTFLAYFEGFFAIIHELIRKIMKNILGRKLNYKIYDFTKLYVAIVTTSIMFLSAATFQNPRRMDQIFYGRHNEMLIPILIIFAVFYINKYIRTNTIIQNTVKNYVFLALCSLVAFKQLTSINFITSIPRSITAIYLFYKLILDNPVNVFIVIILIFAFITFCLLLHYKISKKVKYYIIILTINLIQIFTYSKAIQAEYIDNLQLRSPYWCLEKVLNYSGLKIYAVKIDGLNNTYNYLLQLMSLENEVNLITQDDIINIDTENTSDCGVIYSDRKINLDNIKCCYKIENILEEVRGEVWVYGEKYKEYLLAQGYCFVND